MKEYAHPIYQKEIDAFSNYLRLKNFSNLNTYTGYMGILIKFLYSLDCHLSDVTKEGFEYYLLNNGWSQSTQRHGIHKMNYIPFMLIFAERLTFRKQYANCQTN